MKLEKLKAFDVVAMMRVPGGRCALNSLCSAVGLYRAIEVVREGIQDKLSTAKAKKKAQRMHLAKLLGTRAAQRPGRRPGYLSFLLVVG